MICVRTENRREYIPGKHIERQVDPCMSGTNPVSQNHRQKQKAAPEDDPAGRILDM